MKMRLRLFRDMAAAVRLVPPSDSATSIVEAARKYGAHNLRLACYHGSERVCGRVLEVYAGPGDKIVFYTTDLNNPKANRWVYPMFIETLDYYLRSGDATLYYATPDGWTRARGGDL